MLGEELAAMILSKTLGMRARSLKVMGKVCVDVG